MKDPSAMPSRWGEGRASVFAVAAFAATWMLSVWRVRPSAQWSGDCATIQGTLGTAVGSEGVLSAVLSWSFRLVPFGTPVQRLSMVSAFGAAWAAWFAFRLVHGSLDRDPPHAWSRCCLSLGASLLVTLGTAAQCEATRPNGSTVALALGLASLWHVVRLATDRPRSQPIHEATGPKAQGALLLGCCVAVTCLESHLVGLLTLLVVVTVLGSARLLAARPIQPWLLLGFGFPYLAVGLPWWFARRNLAAASSEHGVLTSLRTLRPFSGGLARLDQWVSIVGPIWCGLACVGLVLLLLRRERRSSTWIFVTLAGTFLLMPSLAAESGGYGLAVTLIGAVVLSLASASGLRDAIQWLTVRRSSAKALATTLVVLGQAVTILARSDETSFALEHHQDLGSDAWTDEALAVLPARSIILARTPSIVERILAAQLAEGMRPDVLVVPLERTTDPRVVDLLLSAEPSLMPLLRDLAINGRPTENSMSGLADVRPLYVEFDASWDPRLREHLLVLPFFHRVLSQTLGRSDRAAVIPEAQRAVTRLLGILDEHRSGVGAALGQRSGSTLTRIIIDRRLREQLTLLLALGDRQSFDALASEYDKAFAASKWLARVRQRVGSANRGTVDVFDLLDEGAAPMRDAAAASQPRKQG